MEAEREWGARGRGLHWIIHAYDMSSEVFRAKPRGCYYINAVGRSGLSAEARAEDVVTASAAAGPAPGAAGAALPITGMVRGEFLAAVRGAL